MSETDDLNAFRRLLEDAERICFFTGAGISTESGIPDFRSPGTGIWNKVSPIEFQDFVASEASRTEYWRRRFTGKRPMAKARPNQGHLGVAKLFDQGKGRAVITQNVDNLHQDSGIPEAQVIELHGNGSYAKCLSCHTRYELAEIEQQFHSLGNVEPCGRCGGLVKPATISFGQPMPEDAMDRAREVTEDCDLMVVAGTTLIVYPAAGFPEYAKQLGATLVILNREATPLDPLADLILHREIGPSMAFVMDLN